MPTSDGREIELSILPLNEIKPHEATISSALQSLRYDMKRTQLQRDPILVDKRSRIALDGMHRIASLVSLGAKYALCAEYEYSKPEVKLERWLRYFIAPHEDLISKVLTLFNMEKSAGLNEALGMVDSGTARVALLNRKESHISREKWGVLEVYRNIGATDELCEKDKIQVSFAVEEEKFQLYSSESVFVLYPLALGKRDVIAMVNEGGLFPYKTTRHIVPIRPMGVYFPLNMLVESSLEQCEGELERIVKFSNVHIEERDVWYEGRRYSEPIAVFRKQS